MNTKRILAVDDEPNATRNLKLNLESTGSYEVLGENEAVNALAAARTFQPDLILLDMIFPPDVAHGGSRRGGREQFGQSSPHCWRPAAVVNGRAGPGANLSRGRGI